MKEKDQSFKRWVGCPTEAEYFGEDRKSGKVERKRASAKDRSKYKKTDREKREKLEAASKTPVDESLLRGRVLSITSAGIIVGYENQTFLCNLRGILKKEKTQHKNLVTVGDFVLFETNAPNEGIIASIEPRHSFLSRADNLSRRKEQLIASNIDQVLITVSVVEPLLKPFLVDRYIIASRLGNMTPIIIVNKIDLLETPSDEKTLIQEEQYSLYRDFLQAYSATGIKVISVSATSGEGMEELRGAMQDKASVFSGQSGVGKSSLIAAITGLDLRIGGIVERTKKGTHTTTTANLLILPFGGWCIDTPGIKSFGLWDLNSSEIESYFEEIHKCGRGCKYPDCTHTQESGCAVIEAVENGKIHPLRYSSYRYLIESESQEHKRR